MDQKDKITQKKKFNFHTFFFLFKKIVYPDSFQLVTSECHSFLATMFHQYEFLYVISDFFLLLDALSAAPPESELEK